MFCTKCDGIQVVIDSREEKDGNKIKRIRACKRCGRSYKLEEKIEAFIGYTKDKRIRL